MAGALRLVVLGQGALSASSATNRVTGPPIVQIDPEANDIDQQIIARALIAAAAGLCGLVHQMDIRNRTEKSSPLGVMTGAFVPKDSLKRPFHI